MCYVWPSIPVKVKIWWVMCYSCLSLPEVIHSACREVLRDRNTVESATDNITGWSDEEICDSITDLAWVRIYSTGIIPTWKQRLTWENTKPSNKGWRSSGWHTQTNMERWSDCWVQGDEGSRQNWLRKSLPIGRRSNKRVEGSWKRLRCLKDPKKCYFLAWTYRLFTAKLQWLTDWDSKARPQECSSLPVCYMKVNT